MEYAASPFEIKALDEAGCIEGLLAGFGNVDRGGDMLLAGAFTKTLATRTQPLPMLLHHDQKRPIGVWREWEEKTDGLYVKGRLTLATRDAQEARALANDGALTGLSIGYKAINAQRDRTGVRTIAQADLHEGSLVAVPMNDKTRVTAIKAITGARDLEDLLQEAGLSGRKAKAAASAAWKSINQTEDETQADAELAALIQSATARLATGGR